jgi:hypothetical protein
MTTLIAVTQRVSGPFGRGRLDCRHPEGLWSLRPWSSGRREPRPPRAASWPGLAFKPPKHCVRSVPQIALARTRTTNSVGPGSEYSWDVQSNSVIADERRGKSDVRQASPVQLTTYV